MAGELRKALEVLNGRKEAIRDGRDEFTVADQEFGALLSGFDLDLREVARLTYGAVESHQALLAAGAQFPGVITAATIDGLVLGLLVSRERQKAEAS